MSQLIMRAKFSRCGEPIPMRVDKRDYLFQENPAGDFVAIIDSEEHANYLERTGNFERYDQKAAMKREQERWADEVLVSAEAKAEAKTASAKTEAKTAPAKSTRTNAGAKAEK